MTHADEPEQVSVKTTGKVQNRTLFRGTLDDAKKFIEDHFPRIHVEPGMHYEEEDLKPDAQIHHDDGSVSKYMGEKWESDKKAPAASTVPDATPAQPSLDLGGTSENGENDAPSA